ncbi:sodium- and chloride-dependent glycine transporter 1-like [Amphiura filiformis]|uniref:sodium- and chloride-dependent glycine transporter 1-like n=1 Tax=Amphiura filiformis TaxID=82378 RepID=UPI003B221613
MSNEAVEVMEMEVDNGDENKERGNWGSKMDFLLSTIGYAVGLGNVWRFPYLTFRNGGGAFLIPYFTMLLLAGLPIFFLEVSFGQYCSQGPITAWRSVPMLRGVGYGMILTNYFVGISYNVIITYSLYYLFSSFTLDLPWIGCDHYWNTPLCRGAFDLCTANNDSIVLNATYEGKCTNIANLTNDEFNIYNISQNADGTYDLSMYSDPIAGLRKSPSEEYWKNRVLQEADNMNETGGIILELAGTLALSWLIVFLCLIRGIKSSGKVVYFTAIFPYVVLVILLVRGVTLPGASKGIQFFITPDWPRVAEPKVWLDAATQIFYSLSAAWGGLLTLASYNKFKNNCYLDSMVVPAINCATSLLAGFVIFSIVGFMANELGVEVEDVADGGFGLAFIAYPEAVARLFPSTLWAILFFLMLITLGLDSQFTIIESVVTAICDEFPETLRKRKMFVTLGACILGFICGLACVTHTGPYWASLLDSYSTTFSVLLFAISECIGLGWIYGIKRFTNDIRCMVGNGAVDFFFFRWWQLLWTSITPAILFFIVMFNWLNWVEPSYNGPYPVWARAIGWLITTSAVVWIPVVMVYEFFRNSGSLAARWSAMSNPSDEWGPALQIHRNEAWEVHKEHGTSMGGLLALPGGLGMQYTPGPDNQGYENTGYET